MAISKREANKDIEIKVLRKRLEEISKIANKDHYQDELEIWRDMGTIINQSRKESIEEELKWLCF